MCNEEILAACALNLVMCGALLAYQCQRSKRYWIRPSLFARKKYNATDFMEDLILDDEDALNLEYKSSVGFLNFFQMSTSTFERILNPIALILKSFIHHIPHQKLHLHYSWQQILVQQTYEEIDILPIEFSCHVACCRMQKPCLSHTVLTSTLFSLFAAQQGRILLHSASQRSMDTP